MSDTETKKYGRAAEPDHYKMQFHVQGKPHEFTIKRQRFEKTVDSMDKMVHSGKHSALDIYNKHKLHLAGKPVAVSAKKAAVAKIQQAQAAVVAKATSGIKRDRSGSKLALVGEFIRPGMSASQIAANVHAAHPEISKANAYYLANKHLGAAKAVVK